jgi:phage shock protein PspC (stress-responsive transcriptional regulator)
MSRFVRPREGKIIAGVAKGLAEYFNVNVWIIRILFIGFFMPGGVPGFLIYIILWMVMPAEEIHEIRDVKEGKVIR